MKRLTIILTGTFVVCLAGGLVAWSDRTEMAEWHAKFDSYDHRDGKQEAEADIARGTPKWKIYGLQHSEEVSARASLLRTAVGVELDAIAGCVTSEGIKQYAFDYNSTVRAHLVSLHGESRIYGLLGDPPRRPPHADEGGG